MSDRVTEPFAPLTRSVSVLLNEATPAAYKLWGLLRQENRAGKAFNFDLAEGAEALGYSVRWLRAALTELISLQLVEMVDRWWGHRYRLIVCNPGQEKEQKNSNCCFKTSKKDGSNLQSSVPLQRDLIEIKHGVLNEQEDVWYEKKTGLQSEPEPSQTESLYAQVQQIAPNFNPRVFADAVARFGELHIQRAIAAIEEQISRGNTRNPAAALFAAIFRGFTANTSKRRGKVGQPQQEEARPGERGEATTQEPHFLPGTPEVFVASVEERSRLQQQVEIAEQKFQQRVRGEAIAPQSATEDLSEVLVKISLVIRELGWSRERVQEVLEERYGVRSQQQLDTQQLREYLKFLSTTCDRPLAPQNCLYP